MVANKDLEMTQPKLQENFKNIMKKKNGTDSKQLIILVKKLLFFLSKWKKRILKFRTNKQKS
jgi:predicted house-cleaning noncanonical NTP pyrophosphatase (MazG superfamily)